jgi:hypothetical protein
MILDMVLEEVKDSKTEEKSFLSSICEALERTEEALKYRDFAVAQGALRGVYNGLGEFIYFSKYLPDTRKKLLDKFNNNLFRIRDDIVKGVEIDLEDFAEVINSGNIHGRVGSAKAALRRYIGYWYNS